MRNVALLDRKHLAAPLTLGLIVPYTLNEYGSIQVRNFVGPHNIEMLVGAKKPHISGWHSGGTDYTPVSRACHFFAFVISGSQSICRQCML